MGAQMSRRDKLANIFNDTSRELAAANAATTLPVERVLAGPVRSMGLALDRMDQETRELQDALKAGEFVVEIDPELVDVSFVRDRLDDVVAFDSDLVRSIEQNGQEVPILVRQHPGQDGRFQVAYGHRRLQAIRLLKRKVRAVIRSLSDEDLVVAQGIENTARKDLSYIERAIFAFHLEGRGFSRAVIMQALSTDKTELSKLLSVARGVPEDLISAIGAAPGAGRRRWMELAEKLVLSHNVKFARKLVRQPEFVTLISDDRFIKLLSEVSRTDTVKPNPWEWRPLTGRISAKITDKGQVYTLSLKAGEDEQGFGAYLTAQLDDIYASWQKLKQNKTE